MSDQPYIVNVLNTVSIDHTKVSKLLTERLGLYIPFAHTYPLSQILPVEQIISVN